MFHVQSWLLVQVSKPLWTFYNIFKSFVAEPADSIENLAQVWEMRNFENGFLKARVPLAAFEHGSVDSKVWLILEIHAGNWEGLVADTSFATGWGLGSCSSWWVQGRELLSMKTDFTESNASVQELWRITETLGRSGEFFFWH